MNLSELTVAELKELALQIKRELTRRQNEINDAKEIIDSIDEPYRLIHYEKRYNRRSRETPYVARLKWVKNKGLDYRFINFDKTYGDNEIALMGDYKIRNGEIIEEKDTQGIRTLYLVQNLELIKLGNAENLDVMVAVKGYLRYEQPTDQLLEILGLKEVDLTVPKELKEE